MQCETVELVLEFLERRRITTLDITGGAPELNRHFRQLVAGARDLGARVLDRCNLTVLEQPGQEDLAQFMVDQQVELRCTRLGQQPSRPHWQPPAL